MATSSEELPSADYDLISPSRCRRKVMCVVSSDRTQLSTVSKFAALILTYISYPYVLVSLRISSRLQVFLRVWDAPWRSSGFSTRQASSNIRDLRDAVPAQSSHRLVAPPCRCRAASRHLIKTPPSKGFDRKQIAPAFSALARMLSTGKAVMKMNGTRWPWASRWACRSTPLIAGIWTSAITHDVPLRWPDCRNSSADANVWTM